MTSQPNNAKGETMSTATKITRAATIRGLEMTGWKIDPSPATKKYLVFYRPGNSRRYLVGKSGALRVLRYFDDTIDQSVSLTGNLWHAALSELGSSGCRPEDAVQACDMLERIYESLKKR